VDYIGSKERLNKWIFGIIEQYYSRDTWGGLTFLDACSGSGAVSKYAIKNNFRVVANDLLEFSSVIISGFSSVNHSNCIDIERHIRNLNNLQSEEGFFSKNYSYTENRLYFTDKNAGLIDAARMYIDKIKNKAIRNYLLYCSIEAMTRVMNTTGVQAAFLKNYKNRAKKLIEFRMETYCLNANDRVKVYNKDILELLNSKNLREDILYIDPPYNERQYGPNYHLYETFVKNDNPEIKGKTGLRNWQGESKSKFCSRRNSLNLLKDIIQATTAYLILISYNSDGLLSREEIENMLINNFNSEVTVYCKRQRRYKSDNERKNKDDLLKEYLFCFTKNRDSQQIF